ncbi:hypothetical protein B0J14DRAFT_665511 [Halenospora varia]|nr:hypothetical protein B0J14DRAFT_665511 [Halenospora varia]
MALLLAKDHTLDSLRNFYRPELEFLEHDINSELSLIQRFYHRMDLYNDLERIHALQWGLNGVAQTLQGFQLLKISINEADYSTPLARAVKLMGEWFGEEYASTLILEYIFDECFPRFSIFLGYFHRYFVKFESMVFGSTYAKYFEIPPKISCTLPLFTHKEAHIHNELFNTTWVPLLPWPNYPSRRLLDYHVRELPCANYPPVAPGQGLP